MFYIVQLTNNILANIIYPFIGVFLFNYIMLILGSKVKSERIYVYWFSTSYTCYILYLLNFSLLVFITVGSVLVMVNSYFIEKIYKQDDTVKIFTSTGGSEVGNPKV